MNSAEQTKPYQQKPQGFLSLAQASQLTGYHQDYLSALARTGKLEAQKIGRNWVVSQQAVEKMLGEKISPLGTRGEQGGLEAVPSDLTPPTPSYSKRGKIQIGPITPNAKLSPQQFTLSIITLILFFPIAAQVVGLQDKVSVVKDKTNQIISGTQSAVNQKFQEYLRKQLAELGIEEGKVAGKTLKNNSPQPPLKLRGGDSELGKAGELLSENKSIPQTNAGPRSWTPPDSKFQIPNSPSVLGISNDEIISAFRATLAEGLPQDILVQLKGEKGERGEMGSPGQDGIQGPQGYSVGYVMPTAPASSPVGTLGGTTYFGAKDITSEKITITSDFTQSGGTSTLNSLSVSGNSTITGNLTVSGTTTLNGLTIANNTLTSNAQATFTKVPTLAHVFSPSWPSGTSNASDGTVYINPASSIADGNLISAAVGGTIKFLVDAEGDVYGGNLILTGSTSSGSTTIAGNLTVQDSTTFGDASTDTLTFTAVANSNLTFTKADPSIILNVTTATDTDFWLGVQDDAGSDDDDTFQIGDGTIPGTNTFLTLDTSGNLTLSSLTASRLVFTDANKALSSSSSSSIVAASLSDETGSGNLVFSTSPTLVTPALGTPSALVGTNITGTASGLTAGNVTTNANLTGPITSVGNATSIAAQTGTGTTFVMNTSPTLVTPVLGVATATSIAIGANTLDTTEWANLDGLNQTLATTSSPTFNALTVTSCTGCSPTTSAALAAAITDETGSGALVFATSPTLVTPILGVATATTINKVTLTAPTTGATLTIADGKTLTASNTLTFTGTDASSVAFGTGGTVAYTANKLSVFAATTSAELAGVISDETGSGALVFANTPTLVTPVLGAATGTSLALGGGTALTTTNQTGTGSLVLATSPTLITPAVTTTETLTRTGIGVTSADGYILTNTTAAAASAQQYSPRLRLTGQGWKTDATAASQTVDWITQVVPVQGTANPTSYLDFSSQVNAGGYTNVLALTSAGNVGIGTTDPSTFLLSGTNGLTVMNQTAGSVGAGVSIVGDVNNADDVIGQLAFENKDSTNAAGRKGARILGLRGANDNSGYLRFDVANSGNATEVMTINTSGNVGIGTTNPTARLQVQGTEGDPSDAGRASMGLFDGTDTWVWGIDAGNRIQWELNNASAGSLSSSGVWTDAPSFSWLKQDRELLSTDKALEILSSTNIETYKVISEVKIQGNGTDTHIGIVLDEAHPMLSTRDERGNITGYSPMRTAAVAFRGAQISLDEINKLRRETKGLYSGPDLEIGEIVAFSGSVPSSGLQKVHRVEKADNAVGVVSTVNNQDSTVQVSYFGQIPVKVSEENGQIHAGDRLTVSSLMSGYAAKLVSSGNSIGIALEDSQGGVEGLDTIQVFVQIGYQKVDVTQSSSGQIVADQSADYTLSVKAIASISGKWSIDEDGVLVAEKVKTKVVESTQGLTTFDEVTGEPYCIKVRNGSAVTLPGQCDELAAPVPEVAGASEEVGGVGDVRVVGEEPVAEPTTTESEPEPEQTTETTATEEPAGEVGDVEGGETL